MPKKKVLLAYSGGTGLDTNTQLFYLTHERGYEVHTFTANLGQEGFDGVLAESRSRRGGATKAHIIDLRHDFVTDYVFPAVRGNLKYEGRYLLGTSLARPVTAKAQVELARELGINTLAHGSTGQGNDQVRFEVAYLTLMPCVKILALWKDKKFLRRFPKGRDDLIEYARANGIPINQSSKDPWSNDDNIAHISYEAGMLENPEAILPERAFRMTVSPQKAPDKETIVEVEFKKGNPIRAAELKMVGVYSDKKRLGVPIFERVGKNYTDPVELLDYLNSVAGANGVGREDMVEDRLVGIKSRGVYETPGLTVLQFAHKDLEGITLTKKAMFDCMHISIDLALEVYNGKWFSDDREDLQADIDRRQRFVNGLVKLALYKGNITPLGRSSPNSLYDEGLASMHGSKKFNAMASRGFIDTFARPLQTAAIRAANMKPGSD